MAHFDSRSHSTLLSASLQNLQLSRDLQNIPHQEDGANDGGVINEFLPNLKENTDSHKLAAESSKAPFRSASGVSSPYTAISSTGIESPLPDPNGLGWPGECVCAITGKTVFCCCSVLIHRLSSKVHPPPIECHSSREARTGATARRRSSHNPRMFRGGSRPRRPAKNSRTLRKSPHVDDSRV